jgi:protoheme IX farnesyltransferase
VSSASAVTPSRTFVADLVELTKPRITMLVSLTAAVGFVMAGGSGGAAALAAAVIGTALVAAGSATLNMLLEREVDGRMQRTRRRPLPAGRLRPSDALILGAVLTLLGLAELYWLAHPLAALVALVTWFSYLFIYTPLKTRTSLSTLVGAVPGALPPVIGWAAARGSLDAGAYVLFAIVFLWQIPHFLAIAWLYRDDYALGGLPMLPVIDREGHTTGRQILANSVALGLVAIVPTAAGMAGRLYLAGALLLSLAMIGASAKLARERTTAAARQLFLVSLVYLTGVCALLIADRL